MPCYGISVRYERAVQLEGSLERHERGQQEGRAVGAGAAIHQAGLHRLRGTGGTRGDDAAGGRGAPQLDERPGVFGPQRGYEPHPRSELNGAGDPHRQGSCWLERPLGSRNLLHRPGNRDRSGLRGSLQAVREHPFGAKPAVRDHAGRHRYSCPGSVGAPEERNQGSSHSGCRGRSADPLPLPGRARDTSSSSRGC
jgi:hypothetical protein